MKKRALIMASYYVPSIKGGGPIQSIKNLVENLSDKIDFYIICADRDLGDVEPFKYIKTDEWIQVGKARVFYTNYSSLTWKKTAEIINSIDYDVIYLNSLFSYKDSIVPILLSKLKRIPRTPIVMAPRGQLAQGALGLKSGKKKQYLNAAKILGIYNNIIWHATANTEKREIIEVFGNSTKIIVANNLTANYGELNYDKNIEKKKGELKIVFVSRVHPKKNLKMAIELLKEINGKIEFNIYGPLEDKVYWSQCEQIVEELPENVYVSYKGMLNHDDVRNVFKEHHIFIFPTLGENFGHVISEALIGGCPVIISDQTPWRGLRELNVGWDIELNDSVGFKIALKQFVEMTQTEYDDIAKNAFEYGKKTSNSETDLRNSLSLFIQK